MVEARPDSQLVMPPGVHGLRVDQLLKGYTMNSTYRLRALPFVGAMKNDQATKVSPHRLFCGGRL